jgi:Ca-activated chloride channel homolog
VDFPLSPAQMHEAEVFYSGAGAVTSNVVPSAPISLLTIRKEVQEVNLTFTVTDHHGHFVRNLAPSDFTIQDNGEPPERITYFESQSELPLRLALVIDSSDSVGYAFKDEKKSAAAFLKGILRRTADLALVIGFNQEVRLVQELTRDNDLLSHAIRRLQTGGDTAIYDAVSAASQRLAEVRDTPPARRAIILITDGADNSSHIKLKQAEEVAQRNECAVYVMSVNLGMDHSQEQSDRAMKELSELTGGNFLRARTEEGVTLAFSKIEKELRSQYLISYKPASVNPDGSFHRLGVFGPKKLRIHHRDGYFAGSVPP